MMMPCRHISSLCISVDEIRQLWKITDRSLLSVAIENGISERRCSNNEGLSVHPQSVFYQNNYCTNPATIAFQYWMITKRSHYGTTIHLDDRLSNSKLLSNATFFVETIMAFISSTDNASKNLFDGLIFVVYFFF